MRTLFVIGVLFLLSGCAKFGGSTGQSFSGLEPTKEEFGYLYLYRPSSFIMSLARPTITIDGKPVDSVGNGSYIVYELLPGKYAFKIASNSFWAVKAIEMNIEVSSGNRKFYRLKPKFEELGIMFIPILEGHFWEVEEGAALKELISLKGTKSQHITNKGSG